MTCNPTEVRIGYNENAQALHLHQLASLVQF
jgi:hypothetical protein